MRFPGLLSNVAALACVIGWCVSNSPSRDSFLFAAVIFTVNAATTRILAAVQAGKQ